MSTDQATRQAEPPRLLASVRSVEEARLALAGGVDILDVKEPTRGSLGRADANVISAIAALPSLAERRTPLSVALGEINDVAPTDVVRLPANAKYAKFGLAGLRGDSDWITRWTDVRQAYERSAAAAIGWIAVIYADAAIAQSPPAREIIAAAADTGCAGVLVDTFSKAGGRLLDCVDSTILHQWAHAAHNLGLIFAVAGQIMSEDLPELSTVGADVIAVRSAVCNGLDRRSTICPKRMADFKQATRLMTVRPFPASTP